MRKILFSLGLVILSCNLLGQIISPGGPITLCAGGSQLLTLTGGGSSTIQWQINGGNIPGATNPTYTAIASGTYSAVLSSPAGTTNNVLVTVHPNPVANFSFSPNNQCSNIPVNFINLSTGGNGYQWDFGDSNSGTSNGSTALSPTHTFVGIPGNANQTFTTTLTVTSSFGCTDVITHNVTTGQTPDLTLGGPGYVIYDNKKYFKICNNASTALFTFTNISTTANTNYQIVWGDATTDYNSPTFAAPVSHTYNSGTSTLLYIVTGANGCKDTATYYVFLGGNPAIGLGNPGNTSICTGTALTFPITGGGANSPATVYTVTFNDATASLIFSHPAPANVTHNFLTSSCGTNSPGYNNSFSASIQASNACASSTATVVPIYVSEKAPPSFDIAPNDTVCVNTNVTFTNTTGANTNNDNGICTPGKIVWKITPATGWTIASGITGNDFGVTDPSLWINGTDVLVLNYNTPGTYTIKLLTGNSICGADSITKTICVNPTPTGSFTLNRTAGCAPLTVNTTTTTNSPLCGAYTYLWTVTYSSTSGCTPSTSSINYLGGTSNTSAQPIFEFNNPGVYTIDLLIIGPAASCSTQVGPQQVIVKGKPVVMLDPISGICQGQAITPGATATCYIDGTSTYLWSFPGGTPSTSTNAIPGSIVYNSTGSQTVSLVVGNVCGTTSTSAPVTITATPVPNIPANITRCTGASIGPLNITSTTPGATFTWANNNPSIGLPASGTGSPIPVFTATNSSTTPVTATITATATLNTCSSPASFTITVNPLPLAPAVTSPVNYCQNITATPLTATAAAGNTLLWYTAATGGTGSPTAPIPVTTATGIFLFYVSQVTAATGCEGPRSVITVNVNSSPGISGNSHINPAACGSSTGSITLTGLAADVSYTVSYTFNGGPQNATIVAGAAGTVMIQNLPAGIYDNITVTSLGCSSNTVGPITLSDPSTPATPTAGSNSPVCAGASLNLTSSTTSPGTVSYTWTGPNSFNAITQNPSIANATTAATGNYFITATINGCTSLPGSVAVVVNPTPSLPALGSNSPVCTGSTVNLTANTTFALPATYSWTGPNGFSSNQLNPTIPNVTAAATGTYSFIITANTGSCASPQATTLITVNPTPSIAIGTATNPLSCSSTTGFITLTGLIPSQSYTVTYTFNSAPQSNTFASTAAGVLVIAGLGAGTYNNIMVTLNGCPSNQVGPFTLADPDPPATPVVNNSGPVCSGGSLSLTSTAAPSGATYNWSGPGGYTSASQNPVINPAQLSNAGTYTLSVILNACTSLTASTTVVINETPATPIASNDGPVCTGNTLNLSALTTFTGPVNYSWTGPDLFTSNQATPSVTNITAAASGTYSVAVTSQLGSCVSSTATTVAIVNTTPVIIGGSSINPSICASATGSITLNGLVAGAAYAVNYLQDGSGQTATITANASGQVVINNLTAAVYSSIMVTLSGCSSNIAGPFTLTDPNPPAPPAAGSNSSICLGATLNLTAISNATGTLSYSWIGPDGFTSTQQNPSIPNTTALSAGMYYVNVQVNNCTSLNDSVLVVINPLGNLPIAASPASYCINNAAASLTATTDPNNTLNWYTIATGGSPLALAPIPATTTAGSTFYYVSQTTALGCEGPRTPIEVIIHPDAMALFNPTDTIGCPSFVLTPAIVNLQLFPANNSDYEWYANNILIGTGPVFPGYTILNENETVIIKLVAISLFGCKNDSMSRIFNTYNLPHPIFTMSDHAGCGPLTVQFQNTTPNITQFNYLWDFGNGIVSNLEQPGSVIFQSNPTYNDTVYVIKLKVFSICDTLVYSDSVRVKSKPRALYTPSITTGCSPMHVLFTNTSGGNNNTYYWNFDDGSSVFVSNSNDTFTHTFHTGVVDTFHVQLIAVNECGSDSINYAIIAAPNNIQLNFSFNGTDAYGCAPHTVAFINNTVGAGSFNWNFDDGNSTITVDNVDTVYHTYLLSGTFAVSVHAQNNCTDTTVVKYITVYPKPVAAFSPSQNNICIGQAVQFTNQSDSANAYSWQFGDGATSAIVSPAHFYSTAGTYTITLYSYHNNPDGSSCIDSANATVQVTATLPGNISLSATNGNCVPFTITFINHDIPSASANWDFGDGNNASGDSVVHTYLTPGVFMVTATVTAPGGCTFLSTQVITISGPTGSLLYMGGFVCYPNPVRLEAVASGANNLLWDFGDGNTLSANQLIVYHNYANPGVYVPSVTLQSTGCDYPIQGMDTIRVDKIDGGFSFTAQQHCGYSNIVFTDTSHVFFGEANVEWDFGDGNTGAGPSVTHQYTASGIYNITMVVTGNSGCTQTIPKQLSIHINNIPVVSITGDAVRCANETVDFLSNIVSADPLSITQWTLSNGATGNAPSFSYLFNQPGIFTLQFIAGTANGCFDTTYHTITINPVPVVVSSGDLTLCLGNSAQLQATGPSPLQWTPIQGLSCTNCDNPIATPIVTTPYIVSGSNNFGCAGYDTTIITIIQPMHLTVSPADSICTGQSTNLLASGASSYQWSPSTGLNNTNISNPTANPTITTNYRVVGYDGYNCFTDTAYVLVAIGQYPTVELGPDLTLATGVMHPLVSAITNGPASQWLWEPATDLTCPDCAIPVAEIKKDITYKVTITTAYGCQATDAINIKVFCTNAQVFIPNAFTPNGDGRNDILMVRGQGIVTVKYFRIFNRWGEVVFERNNFPPNNPAYGWDGMINGKFPPPGVYVYTAGVICENGTPFEYKGNTTIIK